MLRAAPGEYLPFKPYPKYEEDISISDKDLEIIERGRKWWNSTLKFIREIEFKNKRR